MTTVDEKEILAIETLKANLFKTIRDTQMDMKRFDVELKKTKYEAWRLAFYGVAVGFGGTFALAKTISLMDWQIAQKALTKLQLNAKFSCKLENGVF